MSVDVAGILKNKGFSSEQIDDIQYKVNAAMAIAAQRLGDGVGVAISGAEDLLRTATTENIDALLKQIEARSNAARSTSVTTGARSM